MCSPRLNLKLHLEPGMGRRVIVVDDDPLVLELTVAMLEEPGFDVLPAHQEMMLLTKLQTIKASRY